MSTADMNMDRTTREELAMDYVLGLTEAAEMERAERLIQTDALFQTHIKNWQSKFSEIDRSAPEIAPVSIGWESLTRALDEVSRPLETKAAPKNAAAAEGWLASLWQSTGFWRPAAMAAGLATIVLAGGLIRETSKPPTQPIYVAVLQTSEGRSAAVVNAFADGSVTLVPIETIGVPEGRILEVWTLQTREQGPVSIGRMDKARTVKLDLKTLKRPDVGHLFEITVEPAGGSPTGKPTGPILMKGLTSVAL